MSGCCFTSASAALSAAPRLSLTQRRGTYTEEEEEEEEDADTSGCCGSEPVTCPTYSGVSSGSYCVGSSYVRWQHVGVLRTSQLRSSGLSPAVGAQRRVTSHTGPAHKLQLSEFLL